MSCNTAAVYNDFIDKSNYNENVITYSEIIQNEIKTIAFIKNHSNKNDEIYDRIYEYCNNMEKLLDIYDKGKGIENFAKDNLLLYSKLTTNLTKFVKLKDEVEEDNNIEKSYKSLLLGIMELMIKANKSINDNITKYVFNNLQSDSEKLIYLIKILINIEMSTDLKNKIKEYYDNMSRLLQIYNNGENNSIFKENNFSLYSDIQHQLGIIIDMKYDIIENIIKTKNKNNVIQILDIIIKNHKSIIEDINNTVIPDVNI